MRISTFSTSKKARQNSSSSHFRWPIWLERVDDETLDLMEHRRVGLVAVHAIGAAGRDDADRRRLRCMVRICTGEVCVRSSSRSPFSSGLKKNVSCISRAGWPTGKFSAVKL